jgi:Family of unknown function (DUF6334)
MTNFQATVAEALSPMLSAFQLINGQLLQAVKHRHTDGSLERLTLIFGSIALVVTANADDDSVDVKVASIDDIHNLGDIDASQLQPWKDLIGKPFAWGWVTVNQQGYCDGILCSFKEFIPQLVLNVIASSIKVGIFREVIN